MICKKCGFENSDLSTHCINCGARLDGKVICPNCGESYPTGTISCKKCHTPLTNQPIELSKFGKAIDKADKKIRPIIKLISMIISWIVVGMLFVPLISYRHPLLHSGEQVWFTLIELFSNTLLASPEEATIGLSISLDVLIVSYALVVLITAIFSTIFGIKYFRSRRFGLLRFLVIDLVATLIFFSLYINLVNYGMTSDYLSLSVFGYLLIFGLGAYLMLLISLNIFKSFNRNDVLLFKVKIIFVISFIACFLLLYFSIFGMYFIPQEPANIYLGFGTDLLDFLVFISQFNAQTTEVKEVSMRLLQLANSIFYLILNTLAGSLLIYSSVFFENNQEENVLFRYPHFFLSALIVTFGTLCFALSIVRIVYFNNGAYLSPLGILTIVFTIIHFALATITFKLGNKHKRLRRAIINNSSIQ